GASRRSVREQNWRALCRAVAFSVVADELKPTPGWTAATRVTLTILRHDPVPVLGVDALYSKYGDRGGRRRYAGILRRYAGILLKRPTLFPTFPTRVRCGKGGAGEGGGAPGEDDDEHHRTECRRARRNDHHLGYDDGRATGRAAPYPRGGAGDAGGRPLQFDRQAAVWSTVDLAGQYRVLALLGRHGHVDADIGCARRHGRRNDADDVDAHGSGRDRRGKCRNVGDPQRLRPKRCVDGLPA